LTEIALPDSVTSIGSYAFYNAYELVTCKMSKNLTTIGMYAFQNCFELTSAVIPDGVTTIERCAFYNCYKLKTLKIGTGVKSIGEDAFSDCYRLVQVVNNSPFITLTKGSEDDGMAGFYAIEVFNSDDTFVNNLYEENGYILYNDGDDVYLVEYIGQESVLVLPECITKINQYAFYYDQGVISVTIPKNVDCVGYGAFAYCTELKDVTFLNTKGWRVSKTKDFSESEAVKTTDVSENKMNLTRWYRAYWWFRT